MLAAIQPNVAKNMLLREFAVALSATKPRNSPLAAIMMRRWFKSYTNGEIIVHVIHKHFEDVDSTQNWARDNSKLIQEGELLVVTADNQSKARGRMNRAWKCGGSKEILVSYGVHIPRQTSAPYMLSPLAAVCVLRAFGKFGIHLGIKWPNDLIFGTNEKVGGILCETSIQGIA